MAYSWGQARTARRIAQGAPGHLRVSEPPHSLEGMRYLTLAALLLPALTVSGCASFTQAFAPAASGTATPATAPSAAPATLDPTPPPPPPAAARTVDDFDTTTAEDRAEALAAPAAPVSASLGTTIATLGPPAEPGIWIKTPLTQTLQMGRVSYNGRDASVELRPSGKDAGAGSQISLAAMRVLDIPLTALAEVEVFAN